MRGGLKGRKYYFLGIGGIGMSALARHVLNRGAEVYGYDLKESDITRALVKEGAHIHYNIDIETARQLSSLRGLKVIYTPALPNNHRELKFFRENGPLPIKRAQFLAEVTRKHEVIAVAGTHGKTTISSMITHIFSEAGEDPNAFLGGIAVNLNSNHRLSEKNLSILEADEYDRSFLRLSPDFALISNMDPDHLDVYGSEKEFVNAFFEFHSKVKSPERVLYKYGLPLKGGLRYGLNDEADIHPLNTKVSNGKTYFDLSYKGKDLDEFCCTMPGFHNLENAVGAIGMALLYGIDQEKIRKALPRFKGIKRRFELVNESPDVVIIDDYAHHPKEIQAVLSSLQEWYPNREITAVFQPHLFSRTKDQRKGFIESLDSADRVILLDIYPAREVPMPGITSKIILDGLSKNKGICISIDQLPATLRDRKPELVVLMGAGDIDSSIPEILKMLK